VVRRRFRSPFLFTLVGLTLAVGLSCSLWLPWFGRRLVHDEGPAKAEIAVVLAGDQAGLRIEKAVELVRAGYVPAVLVSGPPYFDVHESDIAIAFAIRKGAQASWFVPFPNYSHSTQEEASDILGELCRRGIHSFLLVTSNYHTARAARIYRAALSKDGGIGMRVVAAPDPFFNPDSWWRNREAQKTVFFEWCKTAANALGH
jgi:uncharacterized SAM-binding protein YcdF (DUF218 family)